jgi:hypothetical protein
MVLDGLGLFLLEACAGCAFLLLFFPTAPLGKGFFSLHGALALGFAALALLIRPSHLPLTAAAISAISLAAYTLAAHGNRAAAARPLLVLAAIATGWAMARVAASGPRPTGSAWTVAGAALGGLFYATVLLVMNLGHWYLVSRELPFRLLSRGAALFAALAAIRTLFLGAAIAVNPAPGGLAALFSLERDALFFLFRVMWGIVGPLGLAYFIWKTADMRSNQAATGLLYVALVFVLIGELLSSCLTIATGFPA